MKSKQKKCPVCFEDIKSEAIKCRFCGHNFKNNIFFKVLITILILCLCLFFITPLKDFFSTKVRQINSDFLSLDDVVDNISGAYSSKIDPEYLNEVFSKQSKSTDVQKKL